LLIAAVGTRAVITSPLIRETRSFTFLQLAISNGEKRQLMCSVQKRYCSNSRICVKVSEMISGNLL